MKKFVASLGALSLVSVGLLSGSPVLAAEASQSQMGNLKDRVAEMERKLSMMTPGRDAQSNSSWDKYIRLSGGMNFDAKLVGSLGNNVDEDHSAGADNNAHTPGRFTGENVRRLGVNDAYLNVDADVNDWISGRVGVTYSAVSGNYNTGNSDLGTDANFHVDQAYVTMANFNKQPYFMRAGLQYVDFGSYELHPITKSFTQVMTEINDVALQVGMLDVSGINGTLFLMQTPYDKNEGTTSNPRMRRQMNYGAQFNYSDMARGSLHYKLSFGYLANMVGVDAFNRDADNGGKNRMDFTYTDKVGLMYVGVMLESGPFAVDFNFANALKGFNDEDGVEYQAGEAAKPSTAEVTASYKFKYLSNRDNKITAGYARSWEASMMGLPKDRYWVDWTVGLYKNTDFTLEWNHDNDYSSNALTAEGEMASGRHYNVVSARLAVNFG